MFNLQQILSEFKLKNTELLFKMIEQMNISGIIQDPRVIEAVRNIRIEDFITMEMIETFIPPDYNLPITDKIIKPILAKLFSIFYSNRPLPFYNDRIYGRSTGAPHIIVIMAQLLEINENDSVLICGSKSGYFESIIQDLDKNVRVFIIEKVPQIYEITKGNLESIDTTEGIKIINADPILSLNDLPVKEFDKILFTGFIHKLPDNIFKILTIGGLCVIPIGDFYQQTLMRYFKTGKDMYDEEDCLKVIFSPLITDYNGKN
jgi:protein-L-isoaspartate(D-aspartate) O-methyltransferase